jgi:S-adenosylmethionine synthetase
MVETFGTETVPVDVIEELIGKYFDLRPAAIISNLKLRRPIYRQIAAYGHMGRTDVDLPWEKTDKADLLRREAGLSALEEIACTKE